VAHKTIAILSLISLLCVISVSMARAQSAVYKARETGRDGPFIAYDNGTVLDTRTNLLWAAEDNGSNTTFPNAKSYCESYRGGGHTDWRMPMQDELAGLYDEIKTYDSECGDVHLTKLIHLTCAAVWAWETSGSNAAAFRFRDGQRGWAPQSGSRGLRALPVCGGN